MMIIEKRTYTLHPGKLQEFPRSVREGGVCRSTPRYLPLVGYFTSEIGRLNQIITMWSYANMAAGRRSGHVYTPSEWMAFGPPKRCPMIQTMRNDDPEAGGVFADPLRSAARVEGRVGRWPKSTQLYDFHRPELRDDLVEEVQPGLRSEISVFSPVSGARRATPPGVAGHTYAGVDAIVTVISRAGMFRRRQASPALHVWVA